MNDLDRARTLRPLLDHPRCGPWALAVLVGASVSAYVEPLLALLVPIASYVLGRAPASRRLSVISAVAVMALSLGYLALTWSDPEVWSAVAVVAVLLGLVPWLIGRHVRERRGLDRLESDLAATLEQRQWELAARTRARERTRIAREMHDTLGHELSLIALRAGALEVGVGAASREQSEAAGELRSSATRATEQLNHILGLLADESAVAPLLPSPTELTDLVRQAAEAGMDVVLDADDTTLDEAAPVTVHAALRVVQEGLTNAAKHAPGARVQVRVATAGPMVEVSVVDEGSGAGDPPAAGASGGRGLVALGDRVDYLGGAVRSGDEGTGFALHARIPSVPDLGPDAEDEQDHDDEAVPEELSASRRRARRSLVSVVVAPVAALVVVAAALTSWFVYVSIASVLSAREYDAIEVGASQQQVEDVLPPVEMLEAPTGQLAEPDTDGAECRYYEGAVSFFERRAVYRICFAGGAVVATDEIAPEPSGRER